ncbi:acyl-CoA dehydrogenase family protein, partial [Chloroflexota bacterium]
ASKGWIGLTWPKEFGGKGYSYLDRLVITEEMLHYGAPVGLHWSADRQIGPALIKYGSDELVREFLPKIIKGEIFFALGLSEKGAGSDLAALKTSAIERGDDYILNGQKSGASGAQHADYLYLVARTDPDAPRHRGISEFIVSTAMPGITIRPMDDIGRSDDYCEVLLDNVRVTRKYLVGEKNRGFYQIASQLDYERSGVERLMSNYPLFEAIIRYARETLEDGEPIVKNPAIRRKLTELVTEFEVGRLLIYKVAWLLDKGQLPTYETAVAKVYCTSFEQHVASAAMDILGPYGQLMPDSKWVPLSGKAIKGYLVSPLYTIQAGTSEILRNIIALRGLGLPRSESS